VGSVRVVCASGRKPKHDSSQHSGVEFRKYERHRCVAWLCKLTICAVEISLNHSLPVMPLPPVIAVGAQTTVALRARDSAGNIIPAGTEPTALFN
jgi:hypothetical protein